MFQSDKTKPLQLIDSLYVAAVNLLPNQGSNLDFTDPESVVLPITPLGISDRKITHYFYSCDKNFVFFLSN